MYEVNFHREVISIDGVLTGAMKVELLQLETLFK
jgi:hypothetical protein